jgi:hypothetical protein
MCVCVCAQVRPGRWSVFEEARRQGIQSFHTASTEVSSATQIQYCSAHYTSITAAVHSLASISHQYVSSALRCGCCKLRALQPHQQQPLTMPLLLPLVIMLLLLQLLLSLVLALLLHHCHCCSCACLPPAVLNHYHCCCNCCLLRLLVLQLVPRPLDNDHPAADADHSLHDASRRSLVL